MLACWEKRKSKSTLEIQNNYTDTKAHKKKWKQQIKIVHVCVTAKLNEWKGCRLLHRGLSEWKGDMCLFISWCFLSKQSLLEVDSQEKTCQGNILEYGDIMSMNATSSALHCLDSVYHSAAYATHHCIPYDLVSWLSLSLRRQHRPFYF